ncbi:protein of unknown function [Nitrospira japonica]|uniref:Uncharacterized protein n=1 Tax=Nitrospira japonica TaxID=1325564 RepID=A0A1W1I4E6_9BACT|nr:protein of unknown function [Nitrospira japonica]
MILSVLVNERDRRPLDQWGCYSRIQHMAGRAHPGAECRGVSRFLMVRVLGLVGNRLGRCKRAYSKNAEDQEPRNR